MCGEAVERFGDHVLTILSSRGIFGRLPIIATVGRGHAAMLSSAHPGGQRDSAPGPSYGWCRAARIRRNPPYFGAYLERAGGRPRCSGRGPGASSWTRYLERFSDVADATPLIPCRLFRVEYQLVPLRGHVHDAAGLVLQRFQRNGSRYGTYLAPGNARPRARALATTLAPPREEDCSGHNGLVRP